MMAKKNRLSSSPVTKEESHRLKKFIRSLARKKGLKIQDGYCTSETENGVWFQTIAIDGIKPECCEMKVYPIKKKSQAIEKFIESLTAHFDKFITTGHTTLCVRWYPTFKQQDGLFAITTRIAFDKING